MDIYSYANTHESLINQMPGFLGLATLDNKFAFANNNTAKIMGFKSADDMVDLDFSDVKGEVAKDASLFKKENELVSTHLKKIVLLGYHHYSDGWKLNLGEKSPLFNTNNNLIGVMTRWTDITNYNLVDYSRFVFHSINKLTHKRKNSFSFVLDDGTINNHKLSSRQLECLFFLIRGKSDKEIGRILNLSPRTVESYIDEIKFKMNCLTRTQIIEKSFKSGLTNLIPESFIK